MEKETAATAKFASIPLGMEAAKIFGIPINDFATYMAIFVSGLIAMDYLWKFYRQWRGIRLTKSLEQDDGA